MYLPRVDQIYYRYELKMLNQKQIGKNLKKTKFRFANILFLGYKWWYYMRVELVKKSWVDALGGHSEYTKEYLINKMLENLYQNH